jgi:hypothetical protein
MIFAAGHRIVFRAPYYPIDGPIKFVFNTIQTYLAIRRDDAASIILPPIACVAVPAVK